MSSQSEPQTENEQKENKRARQIALIGLVGTILTVCGGVAGALIGGIATIYKVEQKAQQLSIAAPEEEEPLTVDTRLVSISRAQAEDLDPGEQLVLPELGFVMAMPKDGWESSGKMTFADLFREEAVNLSPLILYYSQVGFAWDEQPLYRLRLSQALSAQFVEGSTENGVLVDVRLLHHDTITFPTQLNILALEKSKAEGYSLYDLALYWGRMHKGGVNSIVSNPEGQYIFEQVTWELKNLVIDGRKTDLALQRWALFAEGEERYYIVEVQYVPEQGGPGQAWTDLQEYLSAFRVIR